MDTREIFEDLVALLEQDGVDVRRQAMGGGGGFCRIKGKGVFFVDTECSILEMTAICSRAVNELIDIESIYLRPQVRLYLEKYSDTPSFP